MPVKWNTDRINNEKRKRFKFIFNVRKLLLIKTHSPTLAKMSTNNEKCNLNDNTVRWFRATN